MASSKFTAKQRERCWERAKGHCEVCGCRLREKGWNLHHRRGQGMGGTKVPTTCADGLVVCGMGNVDGCHGYIEGHFTWALERGYKVRRNSNTRPVEEPVFVRGEWVLFNADGSTCPAPWMEVPA